MYLLLLETETRGTFYFLYYSVDRKWKVASTNLKSTEEFCYVLHISNNYTKERSIFSPPYVLSAPDTCCVELQIAVFRCLESICKGY